LPSIGGRPRDVVLALSVAFALAAAHRLQARQSGDTLIQSQLNERFAERPIDVAFEKYPRLRPPLYPMALWAARRAGLDAPAFQLLVLDLTIVGLALYGRRHFRHAHPGLLAVAWAVAHFNHANLYQKTAETLFAPLLLAFALALWRYSRSGRGAALVGVAASLLAVTRYFGLYLAVPLAVAHAAWRRGEPGRRRMGQVVVILALALVPVGYWMWITHEQTGLWTGVDRTRERDLPESVRHWEELRGVDDHLRLTAKTLLVDFFSPTRYAALSVVTRPHRPSAVEWGLVALGAAAMATAVRAGRRARWQFEGGGASPARIVAEVAAAYFALTIAIWTVGNNDPIYTRFLYPVYPLLLVLAFHAWDAMRSWNATRFERLPWQALYAGFVVVQALRSWRAEPLPVRYLW
jgi:hypothetical protein